MELGDVSIIAGVTETLTRLLDGLQVTLDSPADLKNDTGSFEKLNLYLYQVVEHAYTKNLLPVSLGSETLQQTPLTLRLYYLLTPYASDPLSAHKVLGHAMRVLYDNAIVPEQRLHESLRVATDELKVVLLSSKLEDLTRIWNALQTPYRLSVCYEVRVVPIESTQTQQTTRVTSTLIEYTSS